MKISYETILEIITSFYDKANYDILIGYHFRIIEDFDTHLPRIAYFWQLQLTGEIDDRSMLPFEIIPKHLALKMNLGEVHRWVVLFDKTLSEFVEMKKISSEDKEEWLKKVDIFKNKLIKMLV
jgi:hemoglobin